MNKSFTKTKEIVLDEFYSIIPDSDSGVILTFKTTRVNKKKETVPYTEGLYYPRIAQALRYYASKVINSNISNIDECILINESVFKLIDKLDKEFKQY